MEICRNTYTDTRKIVFFNRKFQKKLFDERRHIAHHYGKPRTAVGRYRSVDKYLSVFVDDAYLYTHSAYINTCVIHIYPSFGINLLHFNTKRRIFQLARYLFLAFII